MPGYNTSVNPKQIGNFLLGEPHRFVLQIDFNFYLAIGCGVKQYFIKAGRRIC